LKNRKEKIDIINLMAGITTDAVNKLKEAGTEDLEDASKMAVSFLNLGTRLLRESPAFREAFAQIHTEFFKYPESAETICQAIAALEKSAASGPRQH